MAAAAIESEFDQAAEGIEIEADFLQALRPSDGSEAQLLVR